MNISKLLSDRYKGIKKRYKWERRGNGNYVLVDTHKYWSTYTQNKTISWSNHDNKYITYSKE